MAGRVKAGFVEPMLLLRTETLPDDPERWEYQLKFDGYRAIAFKSGGILHVRSRNDNDFKSRYPAIVQGLAKLPNETVIDGELVALDGDVLAGSLFGSEAPETLPDPAILARLPTEAARANYVELLHRSYVVTHFIAKHGNLIAIAGIPVLASVWWLFYRRRGYNYVEFLTGTMLIDSVSNVVVPLVIALVQRAGSVAIVQNTTRIALVLQVCYLTYGVTGFLQLKSFKARLGGATVVLLSEMAWMAVAYSVYGAYLLQSWQFYRFPLRVFRSLVTF
jgi:hypothetical protein